MKKKAPKNKLKSESDRTGTADDMLPQTQLPAMPGQDRSNRSKNVLELSWADFDRLVQKLVRAVRKTFTPDAVVGVAHGGLFVGGAIATALTCEFYPVRISRRSRDKQWRTPRLFGEMPRELKGKRVLVVDDVASSGHTLQLAHGLAMKAGAKEVLTAALVTRAGGFQPGWTALSSAELVVFPWDYELVSEDDRFDVDPDKAGT
jgi:hypoxanthine phosphoribosyltransferase